MYRELFATYLQIDEEDVKSLCEVEYCFYNCFEPSNFYEEYDYSKVLIFLKKISQEEIDFMKGMQTCFLCKS